jgi:Kef-type K+ transport system membrane component KefB
MASFFVEFTQILALALVVGGVGLLLKQPLIVSFIAVGILAGPEVLGLAQSTHQIEFLASLGIAILLFVVGLKLDVQIIRTMGFVALMTGLGQVLFTSVFGYLIGLALGLSPMAALYVAVALTFSSTIIIVKLLSDKRELDSLHGQIAIGFLIVQDIAVILAMIMLTAVGEADGQHHWGMEALMVFVKGALMLMLVAFLMRYVLPGLLQRLAVSSELLVLFAIGWAVMGAAGAKSIGFSHEVGAFLAGISLASTYYRELIGARLVALRDFLLLFFFVGLGASLEMSSLGDQLVPALIFSVFVLIGNPLIVMVIMGAMGYRKRTGFLAGLTVAQISEFSLILGALGVSLGHIDAQMMALITLVGLITISASTYMILYSHPLYHWLSPYLDVFERKVPYREMDDTHALEKPVDLVIFGLGRYGASLMQGLSDKGLRCLGVDFNPQRLTDEPSSSARVIYGDMEDPEFIAHLPLSHRPMLVSSLRVFEVNRHLLKQLKALNFRGKIIVAAHDEKEAQALMALGASRVLLPFEDAAAYAVEQLAKERSQV